MENIVYNELLIRGYNVDVGVVDIFDAMQKLSLKWLIDFSTFTRIL